MTDPTKKKDEVKKEEPKVSELKVEEPKGEVKPLLVRLNDATEIDMRTIPLEKLHTIFLEVVKYKDGLLKDRDTLIAELQKEMISVKSFVRDVLHGQK